ncbi:hypothetical protein TTRE_0000441201 [Trichuris trichiura]|uniref:Uncharacterized protein n=1 Tax=Trichuris trichiura TaxID=36087 RepID=A0A077Z6U5_TRITR|nr:hypothetical protein TTRE_0000441201 [Trichuris trichiura]
MQPLGLLFPESSAFAGIVTHDRIVAIVDLRTCYFNLALPSVIEPGEEKLNGDFLECLEMIDAIIRSTEQEDDIDLVCTKPWLLACNDASAVASEYGRTGTYLRQAIFSSENFFFSCLSRMMHVDPLGKPLNNYASKSATRAPLLSRFAFDILAASLSAFVDEKLAFYRAVLCFVAFWKNHRSISHLPTEAWSKIDREITQSMTMLCRCYAVLSWVSKLSLQELNKNDLFSLTGVGVSIMTLCCRFVWNNPELRCQLLDSLYEQRVDAEGKFGHLLPRLVLSVVNILWPESGCLPVFECLSSQRQSCSVEQLGHILESWCSPAFGLRIFYVGCSLLQMGRFEAAMDYFNRAYADVAAEESLLLAKLQLNLDYLRIVAYFVKIAELFAEEGCLEMSINCCKNALQADEHKDGHALLWSKMFAYYLKMADYEGALEAALENPNRRQGEKCLDSLLVSMIDQKMFAEVVDFMYGDLETRFVIYMEDKARFFNPLSSAYYDMLYAYFVKRLNYRRAAFYAYEKARRLRSQRELFRSDLQEEYVSALAATTAALSSVKESYSWVEVYELKANENTIDENSLKVISVKEIQRELVVATAGQLADRSSSLEEPEEPDQLVRALVDQGKHELAEKLTILCSIPSAEFLCSVALFEARRSKYGPEGGPTFPRGSKWPLLRHYLNRYSDDPEIGTIYREVIKSLLEHGWSPPMWIFDHFRKVDAYHLLLFLFEFGRLQEAVDLVVWICDNALSMRSNDDVSAAGGRMHLPNLLVDNLLLVLEEDSENEKNLLLAKKLRSSVTSYYDTVSRDVIDDAANVTYLLVCVGLFLRVNRVAPQVGSSLHVFGIDRSHALRLYMEEAWMNLLTFCDSSNFVTVYNRQGEVFDQIKTFGYILNRRVFADVWSLLFVRHPCAVQWHPNGLTLALCDFRNPAVIIWNSSTMTAKAVDINFGVADTICFMTWSERSQTLAVGSIKGNLLLYFHRTSRHAAPPLKPVGQLLLFRIIPIIGVHSKPITDGVYTNNDQLILSSEDHGVTVLSPEGDLLHSCVCPEIPGKLKYVNESLVQAPAVGEGTVLAVLSKKKFYMLELPSLERTRLFEFNGDYGDIVEFHYLPDMTIVCGFQQGHLLLISMAPDRIGQIIFIVQEYQKYLAGVVCNVEAGTITTAGDNSMKTRELNNISEVVDVMNFEYSECYIGSLELCDEGQLLAVSVDNAVLVYAILGTFKIPFEPSVVALGKNHFAVGINNLVRFYRLTQQGSQFLTESEYMGTVKAIKLNRDQAFVLCGAIGSTDISGSQSKVYPSTEEQGEKITSISLNAKFIAFSTESGTVVYAFIENTDTLTVQKHTCAIVQVFVQPFGVKGIFIDSKRTLHAFDPVSEYCLEIEEDFTDNPLALWNVYPSEKDLFVISDKHSIKTFKFTKNTIENTRVQLIQSCASARRATMVLFYKNGKTFLKESQGQESLHTPHKIYNGIPAVEELVDLHRIMGAQKAECKSEEEMWELVALAALDELKIDLAIHCFQLIGKADKVWYLNHIKETENKDLLRARIAVMMQQYDLAEKLFLDSCNPDEALEMYVNIMDWERAMLLAAKFKPSELAKISLEYAQELEYSSEYGKAMHFYEQAMSQSKHYVEAAGMYLLCKDYDNAALLFLKTKKWQLQQILPNVSNPRVFTLYGKAMESSKDFEAAAQAYQKANDIFRYASLPCLVCLYNAMYRFLRILIGPLGKVEEAVYAVQESKCPEAAKLLASFFIGRNDNSSAVRLLVLAGCTADAMELAKSTDKVELFADTIGKQRMLILLHFTRFCS